jgi:fructan beta-fructosidase
MQRNCVLGIAIILASGSVSAVDRPEILVASFEGNDYGEWQVIGSAFGAGPARGTLPNQMPVSGFLGQGLVNSYLGGDDATGTLTSPPIKLQRRYLNFLIGGGGYPSETCINLLVDGRVVRTATGANTTSGGSEALEWTSWDVEDLEGQSAIIEIVDRRRGGWGHINVDHIVQSDRPRGARLVERVLAVNARYLHLPVTHGAPKRTMTFWLDGQAVRQFEIELAEAEPDCWVFTDVGRFRGKNLTIRARLPADVNTLNRLRLNDNVPSADRMYRERLRPQFHFTSRRGWLNDPNGLVHYAGEWHLFYQHNPYGWNWGNMHWGHAVSRDLVHWEEQGEALFPVEHAKGAVFSGSAIVDWENTSGFQTGSERVLVAAFTDTGAGESIAFSNDRGRTWTSYQGNPVVQHQGRDPRLFYHPPTKRWVMAVYDEYGTDASGQPRRHIAFYTSANLKEWEFASRIEGYFECPDIFELPLASQPDQTKWVLYAADGAYALGRFDGRQFTPDGPKQQLWYGRFYAAQTYSDAPGGRRIQIGWGNGITFPGMPFNQQMCLPVELSLRLVDKGVAMFATPVPELTVLRIDKRSWTDTTWSPGDRPFGDVALDLTELLADIEPADAETIGFRLRGVPVVWNRQRKELTSGNVTAPLSAEDGRLELRIFQDRGSIEVFANRGRVAVSAAAIPNDDNRRLELDLTGGSIKVRCVQVYRLRSAWR